ncbi:MAG TPA: MaoC family dehydratase N-terminal domain-containing protein [Candidatus Sulfotelmatobacter sp.]|nr:MaoC family dehydratase N-terminal domain-containing protein [Candidatus Sulfotelmatobacter sp.]
MPTNYITNEVKKLIGYETEWVEAYDPVEPGAIRRFYQAVMDDDPTYWDPASPGAKRYGGVVAPPMFPLHAFRRPPGTPDPLSRVAGDPNFDGVTRDFGLGLPPVPVPLPRLLNGGNEVEVYALARPGDRIRAKSRYVDIYQKEGKSGSLVFIMVETIYANQNGATLLKALQAHILR